jgi:hypothetical protein
MTARPRISRLFFTNVVTREVCYSTPDALADADLKRMLEQQRERHGATVRADPSRTRRALTVLAYGSYFHRNA